MKINYTLVYNKANKLKADGTAQIFVRFYAKAQRKHYPTRIFIKPEEWDDTTKSVNKKNSKYNTSSICTAPISGGLPYPDEPKLAIFKNMAECAYL